MRNILIWTIAGCLVVGLWTIYAVTTSPSPSFSSSPLVLILISVTCPIAFASFHFHFGVKIYWVLIANAATYALIGLAVESLRRRLGRTK